jgi:plasmid stabilization system protein ParE
MAKEVRWTQESIDTFNKVIEYLEHNWTEKETGNFIQATNRVILFIAENPKMFRKTNKLNIHEALVTSHNLLIYKIYPTSIALLSFWDTRQHPRRKKH